MKICIRIISMILCIALPLTMLPIQASAINIIADSTDFSSAYDLFSANASNITSWDGSVATSFNGGDGSEANPYQISNASELAYMAVCVNAGETYKKTYFVQTADIYLTGMSGLRQANFMEHMTVKIIKLSE